MTYKVFLVEDETVTREGIRDNVNWGSVGFDFCGEAQDGEIAIPLIQDAKPDVLITDIKMPFMDGLQLSKIVREHMPWVKIIILSGHDEFDYAQAAVKMGIWDYLLKPVDTKDLHKALKDLAIVLDRERQERENLKKLHDKIADNLVLNREVFLLKLMMGGISASESIEQSQQLGLDIVALYYLVGLISVELCNKSAPYDYQQYLEIEKVISDFVGNNPNIFMTKKDMEELVFLFKGDSKEQLTREGNFLLQLIKESVENQMQCNLVIAVGSPKNRLGDLHRSFTEALVKVKSALGELPKALDDSVNQEDLLKIDHEKIKDYLNFGSIHDFNDFYLDTIEPISSTILKSNIIKHYIFVDMLLTTTQFISDLGGESSEVGLEFNEIESVIEQINSTEQTRELTKVIFDSALIFRDSQANSERAVTFQQAKLYIDDHFADPDLMMSKVANKYHFSPSYFSTIFRQEVGETFRDYLGKLRINKAKTLLCTTTQKISEVAFNSGFKDAHYFSFAFRKSTGFTPQQFRDLKQESTL